MIINTKDCKFNNREETISVLKEKLVYYTKCDKMTIYAEYTLVRMCISALLEIYEDPETWEKYKLGKYDKITESRNDKI